jgi:hypothetical protein
MMKEKTKKNDKTLTSWELTISSIVILLLVGMIFMVLIQSKKNRDLEVFLLQTTKELAIFKIDYLNDQLKNIEKNLFYSKDIVEISCIVHENEVMIGQHHALFKTMMDVDESILDACQARMEALMTSIELNEFDEYLKTYNQIKVRPEEIK